MSCYHPLIGFPSLEKTKNGKEKLRIVKMELSDTPEKLKENGAILIPCGKCIGCRLDYSRSWADRMMLELENTKKAIFLTLTYNNDNIVWSSFDEFGNPEFGTLNKRDCQLFLKRFRKYYGDFSIRFFLSGEYGSKTLRPHYHAIIFGISLGDISDIVDIGKNELGDRYYTSNTIERLWSNGFVLIADVNWKTCAYVSRYVTKKLNGISQDIRYEDRGQLPEFSLMSRKPGLGAYYLLEHPGCLDYDNINLSTIEGNIKLRIPKYYLTKLYIDDPVKYDNIIRERRKFVEDREILKLQKTDLKLLQYLELQENKKISQLRGLRDNKI